MKTKLLLFGSFMVILCCTTFKAQSQDLQSEVKKYFRDGGYTIDSLKSVLLCDSISFEKWDEENAGITDSTFSINLINSKKLPPTDLKLLIPIFKELRQSIKSSLKNPEKYNSYQIVFLKVENVPGFGRIESPDRQMVVREGEYYNMDEY